VNLPSVFKAISPLFHGYTDFYKNDLQQLLKALSQRSPNETAYFLRQVLSVNTDARLIKLVRQCLAGFPEETRKRLREFLQVLPR